MKLASKVDKMGSKITIIYFDFASKEYSPEGQLHPRVEKVFICCSKQVSLSTLQNGTLTDNGRGMFQGVQLQF